MTRALIFCVLAALLSAGPAPAAHYLVYLLGGQSNGNGRADAAELTTPLDAPQTDVFFYWHRTQSVSNVGHILEDQWTDLAPGSGHGTSTPVYPKEFGSEVSFGRAMADAKPAEKIAIIKYTHGGSNLYSNWAAGGSRYTSFVSTVQAGLAALTTAGHTYELRGMLWQQGESDTGGSNADNYQANLTNLISRVRTDVAGGSALPFVIGSLSDSQYGNITTPGTGPYKVRQAQEAVAAADPTVGIVITDGYGTRPGDAIHFNASGQVALGQNFAARMQALEVPDTTSPGLATTNPADGATGVPVASDLVASFDENILLVDGGTITLRDLGPGADVIITLPDPRVTASGSTLTINPTGELAVTNPYAIRISADAISDNAATANFFGGITDDTTWNFTTGTSEPAVTSFSPEDGASGVALDANLVITFNEDIRKGASGDIVIKQTGGAVFETIPVTDARVSVSGATVTINPVGSFSLGTGYHVQVAAGAIEDLAANPWPGIPNTDSSTWNFTTTLPANSIGTTGIFDENSNATNQLDLEVTSGTLASFSADVLAAFSNDLGGVVDWETGLTATPSSGPTPNNTVSGTLGVVYGSGSGQILSLTFDRSMDLYTNDINGQVQVLSQQGSFHNALIPSGGNDPVGLAYTITFAGADVIELGAAIPSRSTYSSLGVDFRATAMFSGGGSEVIDFTVGGTKGTGDTFLYVDAPAGESITSLSVAFLDDNAQGLTNGQRRPILDDLGFIVASPTNTFAGWITNPAFGLSPGEQGFNDDPDGDEVPNGVEAWFGTDPGEFTGGLADLGNLGLITTFTHPAKPSPLSDVTGSYQWSPNLLDWYDGDDVDGPAGGLTVSISGVTAGGITTVTATASETTGSLFFRVAAQGN